MFSWPLVLVLVPAMLGGLLALGNLASVLAAMRAKRGTSLIPLLGSLLLWSAAIAYLLAGHQLAAFVAASISLADLGGPHWFVIFTIAQRKRHL